MRTMSARIWIAAAAALAVGCGNVSSTTHVATSPAQRLAEILAEREKTPRVSDEALSRVLAAITERAEAGDVDAALVLFELAARQRTAE